MTNLVKKVPKGVMVSIRFPRGMRARIENAAAENHCDLPSFVVEAVEREVEKIELFEAEKKAKLKKLLALAARTRKKECS